VRNKRKETAVSLAKARKYDSVVKTIEEYQKNKGIFSIF
jgi:hypothetical protein